MKDRVEDRLFLLPVITTPLEIPSNSLLCC